MKRLFIFSIFMLSVGCLQAQMSVGTFSLIPRIGVNVANIGNDHFNYSATPVNNELMREGKYRAGLAGGVDVQYQATDLLAVSVGAFFSRQGCRFDDVVSTKVEKNATMFDGMHNIHQTADYLQVPLMAHFYVDRGFSINAGMQIGYLLNAKFSYESTQYTETVDAKTKKVLRQYAVVDGQTIKDYETQFDVRSMFRKADVSLSMGASYEYMNVVLDARYCMGLLRTGDWSEGKNKVFQCTVGYKFAL